MMMMMTNPTSLIKIVEITTIKRGMMMMMMMMMMIMTNPTSLIKIGEITKIKQGRMMIMMMMTSRERRDKTKKNLEEERIVMTTSPLRTNGNTKVKRGIQQIGNKKEVMEGKKEELKMIAQIGFLKEPNKEKI